MASQADVVIDSDAAKRDVRQRASNTERKHGISVRTARVKVNRGTSRDHISNVNVEHG